MWAGIATSEACDPAEEETSSASSALLSAGLETSDATFFRLLREQLRESGIFRWGGMEEIGVCNMAPLRSP